MNCCSKSRLRRHLTMFAALTLSFTAQTAHAQYWPYGQLRQDIRNVRQDRMQAAMDRSRLMYDLNTGNTGAAINDLNRLQVDRRLLRLDQRQLQYDRSQFYTSYYPAYPQQYVQQTQVQYVQQPQYIQQPYVAQSAVQRYLVPAQYAGTPGGYVINYGGINYLTAGDGTMTVYSGPVAQ